MIDETTDFYNWESAGLRKIAKAHGGIIINGKEHYIDELTGLQFKKGDILLLRLKKKWFDMIAQGVKKEEYRSLTHYWETRLIRFIVDQAFEFKPFKRIRFINGYGKTRPTMDIEFKGIRIGRGNPEWGAEKGVDYFCIDTSSIIQTWNYD